jgi:hypothetical protein
MVGSWRMKATTGSHPGNLGYLGAGAVYAITTEIRSVLVRIVATFDMMTDSMTMDDWLVLYQSGGTGFVALASLLELTTWA